jgi:S-DNA-T family DNA segregation ATPase FtsK/SpoIIIE
VARVARRALCAVWRWARPCVLDAAGWLVHTAPGLLARLLWRAVKATPGVVWWLVLNSSVATVWLLVKLTRYVSGYTDFAGVVALAKEEGRVKQEARLRKKWRETAWTRLGITAVLLIAATLTVSVLADRYGLIVHWGLGAVYTVVMALVGRKLRGPGEEPTPEEIERAEGEPFPIADAHTRAEAADCVARAVRAEGIDLRMAGDAARQPWGWQVPIILRRGTPAAVVAKLGELETTLDLPSGGLLAAPDRARRARVVLRLAERDPFASLPAAVNRPPASGSLVDSHVVARRMDGSDLALNLLGANTVVIGVPGSGKSQTLRALADAVSACEDGVVWDLDPSGNGLEALGGGVSRRERDHAGIEDALADAVALAEARPKMLTGLSMGDAWEVSHERPGVVVFIDEYPQLTDRAKTLAVSLLRLGRKARVTLVLAAAEATSDTLGAAIADSAACKILMPCRHADVRLVLGSNMLAEGWRPDRLNPATGESVEDAGKAYVYAAGAREPLIVKFRPLDGDRAREQGSHRAAVGLPCIDADSWTAARARRTAAADITGVSAGTVQVSDVDGLGVVDLLTACDGEDRLWTDEILSRLATLATRYGGWDAEDLAALIRPLGVGPGQIKREGRNRNGYDLRAVRQAWDTHRRRGPA